MKRGWRTHAWVLASYAAVAMVFSWPLPLHLGTRLTGPTTGDAGVYVWNQWVFHREVYTPGLPLFTDTIFSLTSPANLSLHNYTIFQDLVAFPLIPLFGVVTTFNLVYLLMIVLTAYATFLLARHVCGRVPEAWLAGLLFAWSPLMVTRGMGHYSLIAAAPIAIFLLVLMKADGHERLRDAVVLGLCVGWAATADVYYAVYCLMIGAAFMIARVVSIVPSPRSGRRRAAVWGLDVLILCVGGLVVAVALSDGWEFTVLGRPARVHSLYTPVLVLTAMVLLRIAPRYRASFAGLTRSDLWNAARLTTAAGVMAIIVLSPVLYAAALRIASGRFETPRIFWRSSPGGVDVLALLLPNPNHPLVPGWMWQWLIPPSPGHLEYVGSLPLVALAILGIAMTTGWRPSRWWAGIAVVFGLLSLGPFIHVAGINTFVPGPWALLRYVPIVGLTRTPARFAVVLTMAVAVMFAVALVWLGRRYPERRTAILTAAAVLLAFELLPAPATLYSAEIPRIYEQIAAAPDNLRVLELPFGVRDGASSAGNFTARSQFYQTYHGKRLIGGYLSRVSSVRVSEMRSDEVLDALMILSEGGALPPDREARLIELGPAFARKANIQFVVVDLHRAPAALREFAIRAFRLQYAGADSGLELYRPGRPEGRPLRATGS